MNLNTPKHLGNIAQALESFRKIQLNVLNELDCDDCDYGDQQEYLLTIEETLGEVISGYEKLRENNSNLMPIVELLSDT